MPTLFELFGIRFYFYSEEHFIFRMVMVEQKLMSIPK